MKNRDIGKAHLRGKTVEDRMREARDKSNLCSVTMTLHKTTADYLLLLARENGGRGDLGRTVDKLVRDHQNRMKVPCGEVKEAPTL